MDSFDRVRIHSLDLKLPPEIDAAPAREARRAHKPKAALFRRAVEACLEELADARAVEAPRSRFEKAIPWVEVKRRVAVPPAADKVCGTFGLAMIVHRPRNAASCNAVESLGRNCFAYED